MTTLKGINGKSYRVADKPFAEGGEGGIFSIAGSNDDVAKIYHADKRTTKCEQKVSAMVSIQPNGIEQFTWPIDVLYDNGRFAGYVMPMVVRKETLCNIYVYDKRKGNPWTLYIATAKNMSAAVHSVHEMNQVIGDLNPENILVNPKTGLVTIVDTDSFHITDNFGTVHRCGVGMAEFIAPEIQGKHFPSAPLPTFTKATDLFSLSVLIFALLMNGAHPFACRVIGVSMSKFEQLDNISRGVCAYFSESRKPDIDIPRYAPAIESLPKELQGLFKRAFVDGHKNPQQRPTAEEYYHVLEALENNIKSCAINSEHLYYCHASECPWCKVEEKMKSVRQCLELNGSVGVDAPITLHKLNISF